MGLLFSCTAAKARLRCGLLSHALWCGYPSLMMMHAGSIVHFAITRRRIGSSPVRGRGRRFPSPPMCHSRAAARAGSPVFMTSCSSCVTAYGKSSTLCGPATQTLRELSVPGPSRSNFAGQVFLKVGRALATTASSAFSPTLLVLKACALHCAGADALLGLMSCAVTSVACTAVAGVLPVAWRNMGNPDIDRAVRRVM